MDVHFVSKEKNKTVISAPGIGFGDRFKIVFTHSKYHTSDKRQIRFLLQNDYAQRHCRLTPGQDLQAVNDYLMEDSIPDRITKEYLEGLPFNAYQDLAEELHTKHVFPMVGLIQAEIIGKPLTTRVQQIIEKWKGSEDGEQATIHTDEEENDEQEEPQFEEVEEKENEDQKESMKPKKESSGKKQSSGKKSKKPKAPVLS